VTKIALVAHAATAATRAASFPAGESLDEHGQSAARAVTVRRHDVALCSPAAACQETASALGIRPQLDDALADLDLGRWAGRTLEAVAATDPDALGAWLADPDAAPHGGEPVRHLLQRARTWLHADVPPARTVVAVTHPAVIRALIVATLDADAPAFWRVDVAPLTETVLVGSDRRWTLRATGLALRGPA
jgi:broad specificity phosphatase PhoE